MSENSADTAKEFNLEVYLSAHRVTNHIALFVSGGIAAYKACEVLRNFQKAGCEVRVCMTESATKMVGVQTFEALSGHPVVTELFGNPETPIAHIELAEWASLAVVCPATANIIAKMANGIADDAVSSTLLACNCPVVVAPAMNNHMWENPATQANIKTLKSRGILIAGPAIGHLACGSTGSGKLASADAISEFSLAALLASRAFIPEECVTENPEGGLTYSMTAEEVAHCSSGITNLNWFGLGTTPHVVITAGPTREYIDPVRYIENASSGKMGYALARAAVAHGCNVVLVAGPTALEDPLGVDVIHVTSAEEMYSETTKAFESAHYAILAAAVCDYRPKTQSDHKLKKATEPLNTLELEETKDILAALSKMATKDQFVAGFAAETNDVLANAQAKLERKGCSMIIANDVSQAESTFGSDTNVITLVTNNGKEPRTLECAPKRVCAEEIVSEILSLAMLGK